MNYLKSGRRTLSNLLLREAIKGTASPMKILKFIKLHLASVNKGHSMQKIAKICLIILNIGCEPLIIITYKFAFLLKNMNFKRAKQE